jgi:hypothetical protein
MISRVDILLLSSVPFVIFGVLTMIMILINLGIRKKVISGKWPAFGLMSFGFFLVMPGILFPDLIRMGGFWIPFFGIFFMAIGYFLFFNTLIVPHSYGKSQLIDDIKDILKKSKISYKMKYVKPKAFILSYGDHSVTRFSFKIKRKYVSIYIKPGWSAAPFPFTYLEMIFRPFMYWELRPFLKELKSKINKRQK